MKKAIYLSVISFLLFSCKKIGSSNELNIIETPGTIGKSNLLGKSVLVYTTAKDTDKRLSLDLKKEFKKAKQPLETEVAVFVNPKKQFQKFLGIGGAITDASAEVFSKLSMDKQEEFLKAYFSEEGINYNIIRTSIHSSDFGLGSHTYIEEGDKELNIFYRKR